MKNTLLVLGAGASKAVNFCFPTGLELFQSINAHLINDKEERANEGEKYISDLTSKLAEILGKLHFNPEAELKAYKRELHEYFSSNEVSYLRGEMKGSISIDDFTLEMEEKGKHPSFEIISKYAISHIIKGSEYAFFQSVQKKSKTWVDIFLEKLTKDGTSLQNISSHLQIVSFNYERLFGYLFNKHIEKNFPKEYSVMKGLNIKFPYGSLGSLEELPFESQNEIKDLEEVYEKVNILRRKDLDWLDSDSFDTIGFIGFGFDERNFENLKLTQFSKAKVFSSIVDQSEKPKQEQCLERVFEKSNIHYYCSAEQLAEEILDY